MDDGQQDYKRHFFLYEPGGSSQATNSTAVVQDNLTIFDKRNLKQSESSSLCLTFSQTSL